MLSTVKDVDWLTLVATKSNEFIQIKFRQINCKLWTVGQLYFNSQWQWMKKKKKKIHFYFKNINESHEKKNKTQTAAQSTISNIRMEIMMVGWWTKRILKLKTLSSSHCTVHTKHWLFRLSFSSVFLSFFPF